jgi:hypothetical protein
VTQPVRLELESVTGEPRRGDMLAIEPKWPEHVACTLSIVALPESFDSQADVSQLTPLGLLPGDPSRFVVDVSAHGMRALLIGLIARDHNPVPGELEAGTSVVAVPWTAGGQGIDEAFGLWTTTVRNPVIHLVRDDEVLTGAELVAPREGTVRETSIADKVEALMSDPTWSTR